MNGETVGGKHFGNSWFEIFMTKKSEQNRKKIGAFFWGLLGIFSFGMAVCAQELPVEIVNEFQRAGIPEEAVGIVIQPIGLSEPKVLHNAGTVFHPASTMKVLTTYAALELLGPSLTLLIPLTILETGLAIALGLAVAYVRGSLTDRMIMIVCTIGMSISILVYIIVFQYWLAYKLGWFPVQGWGDNWIQNLFKYASLPILILLVVSIAPNLRLYRTFMLDEMGQDYVRTARAKGLAEKRILWVHVLRNAAIPIITYVMSNLPSLLIGAFLVERFFSIPGIGREIILAVERSDFPVIKAITVYVAIATMFFNLLADLLYQKIDPRVRLR